LDVLHLNCHFEVTLLARLFAEPGSSAASVRSYGPKILQNHFNIKIFTQSLGLLFYVFAFAQLVYPEYNYGTLNFREALRGEMAVYGIGL
jgi:hypothetical protein